MMKYLFTGFQDDTNSSKQMAKRLGDIVSASEVLILENNREICVNQLYTMMNSNRFDFVIMFGQKPVIRDKLYLERQATVDGNVLVTNLNLRYFAEYLAKQDYVIKVSDNAGTSYCNWIYYHALKYVREHGLMTKVQFIHIPVLENVSYFEKLAADLSQALLYMESGRYARNGFHIDNPGNEDISALPGEAELDKIMQFFHITDFKL